MVKVQKVSAGRAARRKGAFVKQLGIIYAVVLALAIQNGVEAVELILLLTTKGTT